MKQEEHTIDATGKPVGRIATQVAHLLMGKHRVDFERNQVAPVKVVITNASQVALRPSKRAAQEYLSYSGHPSGQTRRSMDKVIEKHGYGEIVRRAVYGMLPTNRLRKQLMKQLVIHE